MTDAFIASLSAAGAFDGVLADMLPGLLHSKFGVLTAFPAAGEAIEGRARMVTRMDVGGASLAERKAAAVLVLSNDLLARGLGVESLIQRALTAAVGAATDATLNWRTAFDRDAVSIKRPGRCGRTP